MVISSKLSISFSCLASHFRLHNVNDQLHGAKACAKTRAKTHAKTPAKVMQNFLLHRTVIRLQKRRYWLLSLFDAKKL